AHSRAATAAGPSAPGEAAASAKPGGTPTTNAAPAATGPSTTRATPGPPTGATPRDSEAIHERRRPRRRIHPRRPELPRPDRVHHRRLAPRRPVGRHPRPPHPQPRRRLGNRTDPLLPRRRTPCPLLPAATRRPDLGPRDPPGRYPMTYKDLPTPRVIPVRVDAHGITWTLCEDCG